MAAALVATLVACADTPNVYNARIYHDRWPDLLYAGGDEPLSAVIWGNPFRDDRAGLEKAVLAAVQKAHNNASAHFTATPPALEPRSPYVALLFNANEVQSGLPCADLSGLTPQDGVNGDVHVQAAICRNGAPLTGASGHVGNVSDADDPRFRQLMHSVAVSLFQAPPGYGLVVTSPPAP
ncbi:MAG: hypothetical protein QGF53_05695 [Alphaproteobacteria bacterium]|nr:hypothetical protein [Alphaproteobacteria bacterium]